MLEGIPVERASLRITLTRSVAHWLSVGVEANPRANDLGLLVNARLLAETAVRPALIVGTSSDRIGTTSGRAYYATLSKDLAGWTGLPVAPYVGTAYGEFDDEWELIGGATIRWAECWTSTHLWDGENHHHLLDWQPRQGRRVGLVAAGQDDTVYLGLSFGLGF